MESLNNQVLVTGADGFIGSHLTELLVRKNYQVRAFCCYNSFGNHGWLDTIQPEVKSNIDIVMGDIRDPTSVKDAMKNVDIVFHLAALIAIPYSYVAPSSYIDTNIKGTLNVVQAARELDVKKVIHTSTSETYGTAQFVPITEDHPLVGQSPYAASKIGADQLALSYWRSFGTPVTVLRPFNTYGPRQSLRAVIPTIIRQMLNKDRNFIQLGAITPTRDFNFVEDTCNAFLALSSSPNVLGKVLNSASNFEVSIGKTAEIIAEIMNVNLEIKSDEERLRPKSSEVNRLYGSNKLINELTNWKPKYANINGFRKGLEKTVDWFRDSENIRFYPSSDYVI
ncbi:NAD-dependent 4,6-dehydratase LegB [Prochlorococcus marinus]|uniref:NAD-dependent 4,6-dehydratase LegB n=1 Tax=Prochlorococcus marinus TaxID=1219 RepID=UPI0039B0A807